MTPRAEKLALEILQICNRGSRNTQAGKLINEDHILQEFSKSEKLAFKSVIKGYLLKMNYLRKVDDTPTYAITARGENHVAASGRDVSYSFGSNSMIAVNSPGATQSISINDQTLEIQQLVAEFNNAVKTKDGNAMKKAFGYIADKSVDIAIAITTGALSR